MTFQTDNVKDTAVHKTVHGEQTALYPAGASGYPAVQEEQTAMHIAVHSAVHTAVNAVHRDVYYEHTSVFAVQTAVYDVQTAGDLLSLVCFVPNVNLT